MKKVLFVIIALVVAVSLMPSPALAMGLTKIQIVDLYGWGTSYSYNPATGVYTAVTGIAGSGNGTVSNPYYDLVDDGVANGSVVPQNFTQNIANAPDTIEDGFAVAEIDNIEVDGVTIFDRSLDPYDVTMFLWDYDDVLLTGPPIGGSTVIYSVGLEFELWQDFHADPGYTAYNPALGTAGRSNLADATHYDTVTDGTMILSGTGHTQLGLDGTPAPFPWDINNNFNFGSSTGSGGGVLDFTGGAWFGNFFYDNNLYPAGDGTFGDARYGFSSLANFPSPPEEGLANWLINDDSTVVTTVVPEPASMLLLGSGLLGLAGLGRKRFSRK